MMKHLIAIGLGAFALAPADASLLVYSYQFVDGSTLKGSFVGSLAPDGNLFTITAARQLSVYGSGQSLPREGAADATIGNSVPGLPPQIALDKQYVSFLMDPSGRSEGGSQFIFSVNDAMAKASPFRNPGQPPYNSVTSNGVTGSNAYAPYDPSKLSLTVYQDATLGFSYTDTKFGPDFSPPSISGTLSGWISPDKSTFEVGSLQSLAINGKSVPAGYEAYSNDTDGFSPQVKLDGSRVDFVVEDKTSTNVFGLNAYTISSMEAPPGLLRLSPSYGGMMAPYALYPYNPAALTLTPLDFSAAVPEPGSWVMMLAGFGVAGYAIRRRRAGTRTAALA